MSNDLKSNVGEVQYENMDLIFVTFVVLKLSKCISSEVQLKNIKCMSVTLDVSVFSKFILLKFTL